MRILLDECIPARLKTCFPGHSVRTVPEIGWRSSKDSSFLAFAAKNFDVFLTIDRKIEREHDLSSYDLGFLIVKVRSNRFVDFQPLLAKLQAAVERVGRGEVIRLPE